MIYSPVRLKRMKHTQRSSIKREDVSTAALLYNRQKREWMHKQFRKNETTIVPVLESLHAVSCDTALKHIQAQLSDMESLIPEMCWVFVDIHKVSSALWSVRRELAARGEDTQYATRLREILRAHYKEHKRQYPSIVPNQMCRASYLQSKQSSCSSSSLQMKTLDAFSFHRGRARNDKRRSEKDSTSGAHRRTTKQQKPIEKQSCSRKRASPVAAAAHHGRSIRARRSSSPSPTVPRRDEVLCQSTCDSNREKESTRETNAGEAERVR